MKKIFFQHIFIFFLFMLSGCGRLVDWTKSNFNQGKTLKKNEALDEKYIRSVTVYDQFTTCGMFDVLWLSDEIRAQYAHLHARRLGKDETQQQVFLRRQLEENNHFISFFVLTSYEMPLARPDSRWAVFLQVNENNFSPKEIKTIELNPEYKAIFGKRYNRFKIAYLVKFDAKDIEDREIIDLNTKELALYFRSTSKQTVLTWFMHNQINSRG